MHSNCYEYARQTKKRKMEKVKISSEEQLRHCLADMRDNGTFCDAVLCIPGEEKKFPVHRNIISSCSDFFRSLFTCGLQETAQREVTIHGLNSKTMELLIQYAYTSHVSLSPDNLEDIFVAADRFGVLGLLEECIIFISKELSPVNCVGFLRFARFYNNMELCDICWKFVTQRFKEIASNNQEFVHLELGELLEILKDDTLNVVHEDDVFEAIMKWIEFYPRQRKQHFKNLVDVVRFPYVSEDYFQKKIMHKRDLKRAPCWEQIQLSYSLVKKFRSSKDPLVISKLARWLRPRIPSKVIFVMGGWAQNGVTESMETYDRHTDQWFEITECDLPTPRSYHCTITIGSKVFVMGGFDGSHYLNSVICFDVSKKKWEERSPMYMLRCYVSAAEIDGEIYVCGGFDGRQRHNSAEKYNVSLNQWTILKPMFHRRSDAGAVNYHGKLFVAGGFDGHSCLITAECYNPATDQWTILSPMSSSRSGVSLAMCSDKIYAIGGYDGAHRLKSVERYDVNRRHWYGSPSMHLGRSNFSCVVMEDTIYVMGGYDGEKTSHKVESYNANKEKWAIHGDLKVGRSAVSACAVGDLDNAHEFTYHGKGGQNDDDTLLLNQRLG